MGVWFFLIWTQFTLKDKYLGHSELLAYWKTVGFTFSTSQCVKELMCNFPLLKSPKFQVC